MKKDYKMDTGDTLRGVYPYLLKKSKVDPELESIEVRLLVGLGEGKTIK